MQTATIQAGSTTPFVIQPGEFVKINTGAGCAGTVAVPGEAVAQALIAQSEFAFGPYSAQREVIVAITSGSAIVAASLAPASSAALAASGSIPRAPYMGMVSGRCRVPAIQWGSTQVFCRTRHVAASEIRSPRVYWANWYAPNASGETLPGSSAQYRCAIEYPIGTYTQLTKNGSATMTLTAGSTDYFDPPANLVIPRGAVFFVRVWTSNPSGVLITADGLNSVTGAVPDSGELVVGGTTITDDTMTGVNPNNTNGYLVVKPVAIVAMTTRPTFFIITDSRGEADDLPTDLTGTIGEIGRSICPRYGALTSTVSGEWINTAATRYAASRRLSLAAFCSHVICNLGINDTTNARTLPQMAADFATLRALFASKPWIHTTCPPYTSSTNGWGTVAGQSTTGGNSVRVAWNNKVRAGAYGIDYVCDVADVVESQRDSGLWKPAERTVTDGSITSGTAAFTSATGNFSAGDVGKYLVVMGAGSAGGVLQSTISAINSATSVTLANNASTTVASGGTAYIGTVTGDGLHESKQGYQSIAISKVVSVPVLESA